MPDAPPDPYIYDPLRRAALMAPSIVYLTGEEWLRITSIASVAGVTLTIALRVLRPNGEIIPTIVTHTPASNRTIVTQNVALPEGWLLAATVIDTSGTPGLGQAWISLDLIRGFGTVGVLIQGLTSRFVTPANDLAWPGDPSQAPGDGAGRIRFVTGTTPGAGAEITETVPTGAKWQLISFRAILTTSATVANRLPRLTIDDGAGNVVYSGVAPLSETASTSWQNTWMDGAQGIANDGLAASSGVPALMLIPAGGRIQTVTQNIQVGDQWSAVRYAVLEWLDG